MTSIYNKHYQTKNLFGEPYPELVEFFSEHPKRGKILDLGCGQGRDAIALARLGYVVEGIDNSKIGIEQMNQVSKDENLNLTGQVADIYAFDNFEEFDFILFDSILHFSKKDKDREIGLIQKVISKIRNGGLLIFCVQEMGDKVEVLNHTIDHRRKLKRILDKKIKYIFKDGNGVHISKSNYRIIIIEK